MVAEGYCGAARIERRIGMREIEVGGCRHIAQQHARSQAAELVPAHVWQLDRPRQRSDRASKEAEAVLVRRFFARAIKRLQAETNSEERHAVCQGGAQRHNELTLGERAHERTEMPDAGQDNRLTGGEPGGRRGAAGLGAQPAQGPLNRGQVPGAIDRKSTRLNSSHSQISYAVFCLKKKKKK